MKDEQFDFKQPLGRRQSATAQLCVGGAREFKMKGIKFLRKSVRTPIV